MSIRQIATAAALLALVASPVLAQSQPAEQPQAGQSQDGSKPADQQTQEKKQ